MVDSVQIFRERAVKSIGNTRVQVLSVLADELLAGKWMVTLTGITRVIFMGYELEDFYEKNFLKYS